ncbi:MAG: Lrp/AsnC family transcriptional regulator [Planctomycetes bacterium]|nr:Lrp/AsnC family transcriptional regulator [Planctomycetota bacterium]
MELDNVDKKILQEIQSVFPITPRPFQALADQLSLEESDVRRRIKALIENKIIRRLGPIIDTAAMGNTGGLMAMNVPEEQIEGVADVINAYSNVSHNYLRKGRNRHIPYNIWFTMSAPNKEALGKNLKEIEDKTGLVVRNLPTTKKFKIGVKFKIYEGD